LGLGWPTQLQRCVGVDHGGEDFGQHELVDSLKALAFAAIAIAGGALVIQQRFQIISQLMHDS
jgi:hypothetical protein